MQAKPGHEFDGEIQHGSGRASRKARVRFDVRGLVIVADDRSDERLWPYPALRAAEPLSSRAAQATLVLATEPDVRLTVASPLFIEAVLQAAPALSGRRPDRRAWLPMAVVSLVVIALIGGLAWAAVFFLPYKEVARTIPDATRSSIGEITVASLTKDRNECKSTAGRAALDKLVERIVKADRDNGVRRGDKAAARRAYRVIVVDWDLVNAFAVMGNQIVLTRGLVDKASSPDEVAGVLAHEMGHAIELHPETSVLRTVGTIAVVQILIGGWSPDLFKQAGTRLLLLRHSRAAEREADEVALKLLKLAGISPKAFAGFFERLQAQGKMSGSESTRVPDLFSSHPPLPERARHAASVPDYPATPALDAVEWQALRDICRRD